MCNVSVLQTSFNGLFFVNRAIDLIFVKDMIMNFFLAYRDESREGGRRIVKNFSRIRHNYVHGWFPVDFVSWLSGSPLPCSLSFSLDRSLMQLLAHTHTHTHTHARTHARTHTSNSRSVLAHTH